MQQSQAEIEIALVAVNSAKESQATKKRLLETSLIEEQGLAGRWESMAGDGGSVGVVLETLLDAQTRRTDAERELVSAQTEYTVAVVQLQRAMGTLLVQSGISPVQESGSNEINFVQSGLEIPLPPSGLETEQMAMPIPQGDLRFEDEMIEDQMIEDIVPIEVEELVAPIQEVQAEPAPKLDDVSELVDAVWLEEAMYGDSMMDPDSNEDSK